MVVMTLRSGRPHQYLAAAALTIAMMPRGAVHGATVAAAQQWNPNQQAVDKCEQDLTFRMNNESRGGAPQATLDDRSLDVRQQGRDSIRVAGRGSFRRDRFDRGRGFTFDCTVDMRSGNSRTNYRWTDSWDGGVDP